MLQIPQTASAEHVFQQYERLLSLTLKALKDAGQEHDYNVALTAHWIAIVPRSRAESGGPFMANTMGMLGMVSVRDDEEKGRWEKLGWARHLKELGIAL